MLRFLLSVITVVRYGRVRGIETAEQVCVWVGGGGWGVGGLKHFCSLCSQNTDTADLFAFW